MATLKVLNRRGHYSDPKAREIVIRYITRDYTIAAPYFGCTGIEGDDIAGSMARVAKSFNKDSRVILFLERKSIKKNFNIATKTLQYLHFSHGNDILF